MMITLERYIAKTTSLATLLIGLVIGSVLFLMTMLTELKNIGEGDYGIGQVFYYVIMHLPAELYHFFPMLVLLGSIVGLSILSSSRELAVMRASGFSMPRIIYSVMFAAFFLTLIVTILGELIAPDLSYKAEVQKENAKNAGVAVVTTSGVWLHLDNNFIHIERVVGKQLLLGVTRYQFDKDHHLQAAYYANSMSYDQNNWHMNGVVRTIFNDDRTKSQAFPTYNWDLKFNTNLLNMGVATPKEMSLPKLAKFTEYLKKNGLQANQYEYEFWQRIFQPLASLIMIFLAIPFVLSTFSTSTLGWRIIVGIFIGFCFFIINALLGQICIVFQVPAVFAALTPLIIFSSVGMLLSRQMIKQ